MKRDKSVLVKILVPLVFMALIQIALIVGVIYAKGTIPELKANEYAILNQKVINSAAYLNSTMMSWSNIDNAVNRVNAVAEEYKSKYGDEFGLIESENEYYFPILEEATEILLDTMRQNHVTGAFIVLNTSDIRKDISNNIYNDKPGIYMRDLDSVSVAPEDNDDILVERMPMNISKKYKFATDIGWNSEFHFSSDMPYYSFISKPMTAAYENPDISYREFGYWSEVYTLDGSGVPAISYSLPLVLKDGTIYGVIGIDISTEYLKKIMNYSSLNDSKTGSYILGITNDNISFKNEVISGPALEQDLKNENYIVVSDDNNISNANIMNTENGKYYLSKKKINLYNTNTPFVDDQWYIIGAINERELFFFANQIQKALLTAAFIALGISIVVVVMVGVFISRPLIDMVNNVQLSDSRFPVILPKSSIKELNKLGDAIEKLSTDLFETSNKFVQIIKMASVNLGGFEIDISSRKIFITKGFFELFNIYGIDYYNMSTDEFIRLILDQKKYIQKKNDNETTYEIDMDSGDKRWIRLRTVNNDEKWFGLAEDITKEILEMKKIEFERDYDLLTNLLNRRAFKKRALDIIARNENISKIGAMVMIDLDNLKLLNDNYGHDLGDKYLQLTANCIEKFIPKNAIAARMSGDEFLIFFYGYDSKDEIRSLIKELENEFSNQILSLPDGQSYKLRMSGGISWYPEDSSEYLTLRNYADFAMYKVKNSIKGEIWEFDRQIYLKESYLLRNKEELNKLIEKQQVEYYFQPIIDAKTGRVFAYEALMRSLSKTISSVLEIITLARQEYKLGQIERITWFNAMQTFSEHVKSGRISKDCHIFINSIPNQILSEEDLVLFENMFSEYLCMTVLELTEEERMNSDINARKQEIIQNWNGNIAIDDYGTGYNSQSILLQIKPKFIKIDMSFIRNIHQDETKQNLVKNTIDYAHERNIEIIAEGVESIEEIETLVKFGADYFQGFYYGKPKAEIYNIDEDKVCELLELQKVLGTD